MRMRFKPYARGELAGWEHHVDHPALWRGKWQRIFDDPGRPLRLEVGCGKGGFLAGIARRQPAYNYLGIDVKSEMLVVAKRSIEHFLPDCEQELRNVKVACWDVERLTHIMAPADEVERLYINFCNPWYKSGHAKHRLTHPRQLVQYRQLLRQGGQIYFKTDDGPLFEDSLRYFELAGFAVEWQTDNLHREEPAWNVRTEHEQMFADEGRNIYCCVATTQPAQLDFKKMAELKTV